MQPLTTTTILSFFFILSLNPFIHQVKCIPLLHEDSSESSPPTSSPSPSTSLSSPSPSPSSSPSPSPPLTSSSPSSSPSQAPSPSLRTTPFTLPPLTSDAQTPFNDLAYLSPDSAPISMLDKDGDPIDLPLNFNPFDISHQKEPLPKTVDPIVKKTCDATDNSELCVSSLRPFLTQKNKEPKTDTFSLLEMQIKVTLEATQHAIALTSANHVGLTKDDANSLRDCKELYSDALDNIKEAIQALDSKDVGTIDSMLSAVVSDFSTCNDGFQESGDSSPLADYGTKLSKLVSNCLATVSLIKGQ